MAPASYVGQMEYISKLCSEPKVVSKLSNQYKEDLSLLDQLFDKLYKKGEMERINALNEAYAACLKGTNSEMLVISLLKDLIIYLH